MASNPSSTRQRRSRHHRQRRRNSSSSEEIETIHLDTITSPAVTTNSTAILIPPIEQV